MSKIIENFLIPLFLVISVLYAFHSFGSDGIVLNKAYHHMAHNDGYLERAKISLYFSGDPHIQEIKNKKGDASSYIFFFPKAVISQGECEGMVNRINNYTDSYKVAITQVTRPTKGIMVTFTIDPAQYLIKNEQFDSIGLQKGFVFHLYNKELLHKLEQANNQPVLRTLCIDKPCIVIDPGHGGCDTGAIGRNGTQEKEVCLAISTVVGNLLEQRGYSVLLTRTSDCDVQLDERTTFANDMNADLFVSIHANYATSSQAIGVETFCMQQKLLTQNGSCFSEMQDACVSKIKQERTDFSYKLAQSIQRHVCHSISHFHTEPIDRKVKHSVSQVMLGVQMPAILVEVGFLSHPKEAMLLNDERYQKCVAHGIYDGIVSALRF